MVTNTLTDADGDLGDTVATYVFDVALARSLLLWSGVVLAGALAGLVAVVTAGSGGVLGVLALALSIGVVVVAAWGVLLATTRLGRRTDRFVVRRFGLAHHHDGQVTVTKWVDVVSVTHSGAQSGSRIPRWFGSDYMCRVDLRTGGARTFDNYVANATTLGREVERRSLLGGTSHEPASTI